MSSGGNQDFRLGFLTAVEDAERGFVGGLLVTNRFGRPLEFQCTAPVKPNRTQQILYGPTLRPFVLAELIGKTLVEKIGVKPHIVLGETRELLELGSWVDIPVASILAATEVSDANPEDTLPIGSAKVLVAANDGWDRETLNKQSRLIPKDADLLEPFERVREALKETLRISLNRAS